MRNVPTYTRPRSPEILKVSLRDAGPVSILPPAAVAVAVAASTTHSLLVEYVKYVLASILKFVSR